MHHVVHPAWGAASADTVSNIDGHCR
jgi:hypothetical protein